MTAERDSNNAIEHAIAEWESVNAGPTHGVLVRAAKEALAARRVQTDNAQRVRAAVRRAIAGSADGALVTPNDRYAAGIADRVVTLLLGVTP